LFTGLCIEDAAKAYHEFSNHEFIKAVIRLDDYPESLLEKEKVNENGETAQVKRRGSVMGLLIDWEILLF